MKTTRRQELRTNKLSQQIELARAFIKQNAAKLVAICVVGIAIIIAGYWHVHSRRQHLMDGWATLSRPALLAEAGSPISVFESLAREELDDALTAEAWLKVGDVASSELRQKEAKTDLLGDGSADQTDWSAKAEEAYALVVTRFPDNVTASGKAMVLLGVLAEDRNDMNQARQWYQRILDNQRYAGSPFVDQAAYRLGNLDRWSEPVTFPEPEQTVPLPPESEADLKPAQRSEVAGRPKIVQQSKPTPAGSSGAQPILESARPAPVTTGGEGKDRPESVPIAPVMPAPESPDESGQSSSGPPADRPQPTTAPAGGAAP